LFYAFAFIDPTSFNIVAAHPDDEAMMKEFTALSSDGKLKTWIAIGGFDFSDPGTATHTTWLVLNHLFLAPLPELPPKACPTNF
jgi:chitinase